MNGIDTNVLVWAIVGDDDEQSMLARQLVAEAAGRGERLCIASVTVAEFVWVLRSRYRYGKTAVVEALSQLLSADMLVFQDVDAVMEAVRPLAVRTRRIHRHSHRHHPSERRLLHHLDLRPPRGGA